MSKLSSYSCQGQRQGHMKKVKNNSSLDVCLKSSHAANRSSHFDGIYESSK